MRSAREVPADRLELLAFAVLAVLFRLWVVSDLVVLDLVVLDLVVLAGVRAREPDARPLVVERRFLAAAPCCGLFLGAIYGAFL